MSVTVDTVPVAAERSRVYRTVLSEQQVLDYFWAACRAGVDRLALLLQISVVAVPTPPDWNPKATRASFVAHPYPQSCFACYNQGRPKVWHHIVAVDHGGSNELWNQVALCRLCHQRIHPWLEEEADNDSWVTPADMVRALAEDRLTMKPTRVRVRDDDGNGTSHLDTDEDGLHRRGDDA